MDAARSSLEIPPPAWGREAALSEGRRTVLEGNAVVTWALATCALIGLALVVGLRPPLQSTAGMTALVLGGRGLVGADHPAGQGPATARPMIVARRLGRDPDSPSCCRADRVKGLRVLP